jgi:hypothetical protein
MRLREIAAIVVAVSALTACGSHHAEWPAASIKDNDDGCYTAINAERTQKRTICTWGECFRGKYEYNYLGRMKIDPMDEACLGARKAIEAKWGFHFHF